jgi:hypothetical protein
MEEPFRLVASWGHLLHELRQMPEADFAKYCSADLRAIPMYWSMSPEGPVKVWPKPCDGCEVFQLRKFKI